jgi:secretion/DNA translocation related TadE-like protein
VTRPRLGGKLRGARPGPRPSATFRDDRGAGAVLAIALVMAVVVIGLAGVSLAAGLSARQRVIGAADLAALAAADAASGAIGGAPCEVANRVAEGNGARLTGCKADGLIVTVTVAGSFAGIPIEARARAGPPS